MPRLAEERLVKACYVAEFPCCVPCWNTQYRIMIYYTLIPYPSQKRDILWTDEGYITSKRD